MPHLHDSFLQLTAERGLPALAAYLWMMAVSIGLAVRRFRRQGGFAGPRSDLDLGCALALVGFALSTAWLAWFVVAWSRTGSFPLDGGPYLPMGLLGVLLFAVSWMWGLVTGLAVVRESRAQRRPTPPRH